MVGHEADRPRSVLTSILVAAEAVVIGDQGQGSALSQSLRPVCWVRRRLLRPPHL